MRYIRAYGQYSASIDDVKSTNDLMRPTINGKGTYDIILPKIKRMVEKEDVKVTMFRNLTNII